MPEERPSCCQNLAPTLKETPSWTRGYTSCLKFRSQRSETKEKTKTKEQITHLAEKLRNQQLDLYSSQTQVLLEAGEKAQLKAARKRWHCKTPAILLQQL